MLSCRLIGREVAALDFESQASGSRGRGTAGLCFEPVARWRQDVGPLQGFRPGPSLVPHGFIGGGISQQGANTLRQGFRAFAVHHETGAAMHG